MCECLTNVHGLHVVVKALPSEPTATDCDCPRVHTTFKTFHQPWEIESTRNLYYTTDIVPIKVSIICIEPEHFIFFFLCINTGKT